MDTIKKITQGKNQHKAKTVKTPTHAAEVFLC